MIFPEPYDMTGSTRAKVPKTNAAANQQPLVILPSFMDVDTPEQPPPAETLQRQIKPKPVQPTLFVPPKPPQRMVIKQFNPSAISLETPPDTVALPKTTYYRRLKKGKTTEGKGSYTCKLCKKPWGSFFNNLAHRQFKGKRWCPEKDVLTYEEWLNETKEFFKNKDKGK